MMKFIKNSYKAVVKFASDWWRDATTKQKKQKKQKPPGYWARIMGVTFFWIMMTLVLLLAVSSFSQNESAESTEEVTVNEATLQPSVQFGENFLNEFLTISEEEDSESRTERLSSYLVNNLDVSNNITLGTDNNNQSLNMEVSEIDLHDIEETGENTSIVTYEVVTNTTITNDENSSDSDDGDESQEENAGGGEKTYLIGVPIVYSDNQHAVYDDTKIFGEFEENRISYDDGENLSPYHGEESEVNDFLNTFFETYIEDSSERIVYMTEEDTEIPTLDGAFEFNEIEEVNLGVEDSETENPDIHAKVRVNMTDDAGVNYSNVYNLIIRENEERFEVISFEVS